MEVLLCERVNDLRHSLFQLLNCLITTGLSLGKSKSHREQGLDYRKGDELSWCPSWSNSLWLPDSSHTSHPLSQTPCISWISYATQRLMLDSCKMLQKQSEVFHTFLWHFFQVKNVILLHIVLLKCPVAFLKFTSFDYQALVGCIPIAAVAVHLNLKS